MNNESKRAKALQQARQEILAFTPLCLASGVLYGTCVLGEALVIFEKGIMDYFKSKSVANTTAMRLKFLSYKAVAAGATFYVPPPLSMPSRSQQLQLRALRFTRLGVGLGTVAIVATSATWAYRQGIKDYEDELLDGVLPINLRGSRSPYFLNGNLIVRLGNTTEVAAMLRDFDGRRPTPLPVLVRGPPEGIRGDYLDKKKLRAAVKSASKGLSKGCYLRQDTLGATLSLSKAEGGRRRVIVQAGGWSHPEDAGKAIYKRRQARKHRAFERTVQDLQASTGADVAVVMLRNGPPEDARPSFEKVEIDARLPLLCEVVRWVDKRSHRRGLVATSFLNDSNKDTNDSMARDEDEWLLVERLGSGAREVAVGVWMGTKEAHEQIATALFGAWHRIYAFWYEVHTTSSKTGEKLSAQVRGG